MELLLTPNDTTNTTLTTPDGVLRYKIETPSKFFGRTTSIHRFEYDRAQPISSSASESTVVDDTESDSIDEKYTSLVEMTGEKRSTEIAEIHWNILSSSRLRFGAIEVDIAEYMPPEGLLRRTRVMHQCGQSYRWTLGMRNSTLVANDGTDTPIARTHRRSWGIFGKARKASLEIYPAGQHIVDAIVVTWAYIETRRREREK